MISPKKIKLGIIEDSRVYADSLRLFFSQSEEVEVVFSTDQKEEIIPLCYEYRPQILLMDISLGYFTGIEAMKMVKRFYPAIKVLMCTNYHDKENLFDSINNGASGYILKSTPAAEIVAAVVEACQGGTPVTPLVATRLFQAFRQNNLAQQANDILTSRENEIMLGLVKGFSYKELATSLNISLSTVRTHIENIYLKLEVNSKAEAVAKYLKNF